MDTSPPLISPALPYKDRRVGLIVFGVFQIFLGGVAAMFVPLLLVGAALTPAQAGAPMGLRQLGPAMLVYAGMALWFIWMGVGSCMTRRWARALTLIFSWSWLIVGLLGTMFFCFLLPEMEEQFNQMSQQAQPAGAAPVPGLAMVAIVVAVVAITVIYILLPLSLVLFYRSRHVKATCEARCPESSWTDAVPLPLLALALWQGFSACWFLAMPIIYNGALPIFGRILTGPSGAVFCFVLAAFLGWCAWGTFSRRITAWWATVVLLVLAAISNTVTFSTIELPVLYEAMGYAPAQIEQIMKYNFFTPSAMTLMGTVGLLPYVLLLLWVKRYFRPALPA